MQSDEVKDPSDRMEPTAKPTFDPTQHKVAEAPRRFNGPSTGHTPLPLDNDEVRRRFRTRDIPSGRAPFVEALRNEASVLAVLVNNTVPPGRYQALALTAIEEALMWAVKGIAHEATP